MKRRLAMLALRRAAGDAVRDWLIERGEAARKRGADKRQARLAAPRGVDRVPNQLRVDLPTPTLLVESGESLRAHSRAATRRKAREERKARRHAQRADIECRYADAAAAKEAARLRREREGRDPA